MRPRRQRSPSKREQRLRVLDRELDVQRVQAAERTRGIESKASFVVVAAGVLATGAFASSGASRTWLELIPLGLTLLTIIASSVVLWPRKAKTVSARNLTRKWLNSCKDASALETYLVKVKTKDVTLRNEQNERRAVWLKRSFALLALTLVAVGAVAAAESTFLQENEMPQPTENEDQESDPEVLDAFESLTHGDTPGRKPA